MQRKQTYVFSEIEEYRETLENRHLRTKNLFVLILLFLLGAVVITYMFVSHYEIKTTLSLMTAFLAVLLINLACLAYGQENHRFNLMNQYITTIGIFGISIGMIFIFKSPSMIATLFIAYAITAFYQDMKAMLLSNSLLFFAVVMILFKFPEYLAFANTMIDDDFGIPFFFLVFIVILTISSYIIIKQKRFFYNQIALSKETEFRNIDLMMDLQKTVMGKTIDLPTYYANVEKFAQAFTKKIGTENILEEKIHILQDLENHVSYAILLEKYPQYSIDEFDRLQDLLMGNHEKLLKLSVKVGFSKDIHVKRREIFSETQFKSFNHQHDSLEIKILAFAVFYTSLKRGNSMMRPLTEEEIYNVLVYTDYYYMIDPRIMHIYQENNKVFDDIVTDDLGRRGK